MIVYYICLAVSLLAALVAAGICFFSVGNARSNGLDNKDLSVIPRTRNWAVGCLLLFHAFGAIQFLSRHLDWWQQIGLTILMINVYGLIFTITNPDKPDRYEEFATHHHGRGPVPAP